MDIETMVAGSTKSAMAKSGATKTDLWKVPRDAIKVIEGFNVRSQDDPEYQSHLHWLANSIRENGFHPDRPLTGYVARENGQDVIYVIDGHSRLAALDMLLTEGIEVPLIPVVVRPKGTTAEDLTVALFTSNGGKPLTLLETGQVCKRLVDFGWEVSEIAQRIGKSSQHVENALYLAGTPPAIRKLVSGGQVSGTLAVEITRQYGEKALEKLTQAVESASKSGKKRATAKDIKQGPLAIKLTVRHFNRQLVTAMEKIEESGVDLWDDVDEQALSQAGIDGHLAQAILAVQGWVLSQGKT